MEKKYKNENFIIIIGIIDFLCLFYSKYSNYFFTFIVAIN